MMEYFLGTIQLFPYNFAPNGWVLCNGSLLDIATHQALYALIGTKFGGNGSTNFAVPDLRSAAIGPYNQYYISMGGIWPSRQ